MAYKLNAKDGKVVIIKKAGSAYVKTSAPEGMCKGLIESADTVKASDRWEGFGIVINGDEIYFEGTFKEDTPVKPANKPKEVFSSARKDFARREDHGKKKKH